MKRSTKLYLYLGLVASLILMVNCGKKLTIAQYMPPTDYDRDIVAFYDGNFTIKREENVVTYTTNNGQYEDRGLKGYYNMSPITTRKFTIIYDEKNDQVTLIDNTTGEKVMMHSRLIVTDLTPP